MREVQKGGDVMKKKNKPIKEAVLNVLYLLIAILFLLLTVIITPFDYMKYKRTRYYKDTKERYTWLCTSSYYIGFYEMIKKANLPIDYYRYHKVPTAGYGYFVYRDTLILNDYDPCYDEEHNVWQVEIEDEYVDLAEDVQRNIDQCNELLKAEVCKRAVVLIDKDLLAQHPDAKYENISFLPVSNDLDVDAIKTILY